LFHAFPGCAMINAISKVMPCAKLKQAMKIKRPDGRCNNNEMMYCVTRN